MKDLGVSVGTNPTPIPAIRISLWLMLGITAETSATTVSPNESFTREQAATMLRNACKVVGENIDNPVSPNFQMRAK